MRIIHYLFLIFFIIALSGCVSDKLAFPVQSLGANHQSNTRLGVKYLLGYGVKQSDEQAFYYFKKAADQGDRYAQNEVAYLYATGRGTPKNNEKAFFYYQLAAYQNVPSAQFNLGLMYLKGMGTEVNVSESYRWIDTSAGKGFYPAKQYLLQHKKDAYADRS